MSERPPRRPRGAFNVQKCLQYLRYINIEVDAETAESWRDAERVHRYLNNERKPARQGAEMSCRKGHTWRAVFDRRRRTKAREAANKKASTCPECGREADAWSLEWDEARDGSLRWIRPSVAWRGTDSYRNPGETP